MPFRQSNLVFYVRFYFHQQFFKRWYIGEDVKSLKRPKEFLKMLENGFFDPPRICFFSFPSPFSDSSSSFRSKSHPSSFLNKTFSFIFAFESNGNPLHQRQRLHLHFRGKLIQERFATFINWHVCNPWLCGRVGLLFRKVLGSVHKRNLFFPASKLLRL